MDSCAGLAEARGCPIRIFTDQSLFAAPRNFSQRTTSFIASQCQGIHQMLLSRLMLSLSMSIPGCPASADGTDGHRSKKDLYVLDLPAAERSSSCVPRQSATRTVVIPWCSQPSGHASKSLHSQCQSARRQLFAKRRNCHQRSQRPYAGIQHYRNGGARRDRTDDLKLAKLPLSQLSYGPVLNPPPEEGPQDQPQSGGPGKI